MRTILCAALAVMVVLTMPVRSGLTEEEATSRRTKALELLDKGLRHYRVGEYAKAADFFGEIMALEPDSQLALMMRQRAGVDQLVQMLANDQVAAQVREILELSQKELERVRRAPEEIKSLVKQFLSEELLERWRAERELVAAAPYSVPFLLDYLDVEREKAYGLTREERITIRAHAEKTIREMGTRAVLPLLEALHSPSTDLKVQVCRFLAGQGDCRAIPSLKRTSEDGHVSERLRHEAFVALKQLAERVEMSTDRPAVDFYLSLAESYYYSHPRVVDYVPGLERVIWRWRPDAEAYGERIYCETVPQYAYNEQMAEKLICEALGVGADQERLPQYLSSVGRLGRGDSRRSLLALLAANNYSRLVETTALAEGAHTLSNTEVPEEVRRSARESAQALQKVHLTNRLMGAAPLNDALDRHLVDHDYAMAVEAIADIRALGDRGIPRSENALLKAMRVPPPAVRLAATEALMHIAPDGGMGGADLAVTNVIAACAMQTRPHVLIITKDKPLFHELAGALMKAKYTCEQVESVGASFGRIRNELPHVSVMVIDPRNLAVSLTAAVSGYREDAAIRFIPLLLLSPPREVEKNREAFGDSVASVLSLQADPEDVAGAVALVFGDLDRTGYSVAAARRHLVRLLETVAALGAPREYPLSAAGSAMADLLKAHPEEVRLAAARCLRVVGEPAAFEELAGIFFDAEAAPAMRLAAGRAAVSAVLASAPGGVAEMDRQRRDAALAMASHPELSEELRQVAVRLFAARPPERQQIASAEQPSAPEPEAGEPGTVE